MEESITKINKNMGSLCWNIYQTNTNKYKRMQSETLNLASILCWTKTENLKRKCKTETANKECREVNWNQQTKSESGWSYTYWHKGIRYWYCSSNKWRKRCWRHSFIRFKEKKRNILQIQEKSCVKNL